MRSAGIVLFCAVLLASAYASPKGGTNSPPANLDMYFTVPPAVTDSARGIAKLMLTRMYETGLFTKRTCMIFAYNDTIQVRIYHNTRPLEDLRNLLETRGQLRLYESSDSMYSVRTDSSLAPSGYIPLKDQSNEWHYVRIKTVDAALTEVDTRIEEFGDYMVYGELALNQMEPKSVTIPKGAFLVATIDNTIYATSLVVQNIEEKARVILVNGVTMTQAYILGQALLVPYVYPVTFIGWREIKNSAHWLLPGKKPGK